MGTLILILAAIAVAATIGLVLLRFEGDGYSAVHEVAAIAGVATLVGTGVTAIAYAFTVWSWIAADHKANIINREYGTNYTREEVFFARDVIDTIREIDRKRIEINGDVMRGSAAADIEG